MNDFMTLLKFRQSCRNYDGRPVEKEKLQKCLDAATLSPSACNSQPWKFYVATDASAQKVRECVEKEGRNKFADNCPAFTVVVEQPATLKPAIAKSVAPQKYAQMDVGLSVAHYCLEAADIGLSTCIIGWMDEEKLKSFLNLADGEIIRLVIATGYADKDDKIREKTRKPQAETVMFV